MTNKQKKILITSIVTPLAAAAVIPSMSIAIAKSLADNSIRNKLNNKLNSLESQTDSDFYSYSVGGKTFDSKEELLTYYENQLEIVEQEAEYAKSYIVRNDPDVEEMYSARVNSKCP